QHPAHRGGGVVDGAVRPRCDPRVRQGPRALDDPLPPGGRGPPRVVSGFNFADAWEVAADAVPEREALIVGDRRLTYAALEDRANRLGHHLSSSGVGPDAHV